VSLEVLPCPTLHGNDVYGVEFRISDTGVGIPATTQSLLFQPFVRGKDPLSVKAQNGSGLGLVISQRLVELMNGKIKLASTVGVGTQISIQIPFCTTLSEAKTQLQVRPTLPSQSRRHPVLIVVCTSLLLSSNSSKRNGSVLCACRRTTL
jgi:hypothetical protein